MLIVPAVELKTGHLRSIMCTTNRHQIWINLPWCRVQQKSVTCQWKSGSYVDLWTLKCAFSLVKKFDSWTAHCVVLWTTVNMRLPVANSGISYRDQHVAQLIETWTVKQLPRFFGPPYTHTPFNGPFFPGLPGWAGTRKVKPIWIFLKQNTVSGSGISWAMCKSTLARSRQITTPATHHSSAHKISDVPQVVSSMSF